MPDLTPFLFGKSKPIMIASVIAVLEPDRPVEEALAAIAKVPNIEIGDSALSPRRIPLAIDAPSPGELEVATRRLQQCPGVAFVNVVFVHFEEGNTIHSESREARANQV